MSKDKIRKPQQVYTLLVQIGRKSGDGLPKGATGAALMIYASGVDEAEAVRETVAILKQADTAPLDVTGYGTLQEREDEGHEIDDEERALMQRARDAGLMPAEHDALIAMAMQGLVNAEDPNRIDAAFSVVNGVVSIGPITVGVIPRVF